MILDELEDRRICEVLQGQGFEVSSVYDLVNTSERYDAAMPVLAEWLPRVKSDRIKEGVARALTVKGASPEVLAVLLTEFESYMADTPSKEGTKWAIGNAISEVAEKQHVDAIRRLARDARHGKSRDRLVFALGKLKVEESIDDLLELLDDADVRLPAMMALVKLGAREAIDKIASLIDDRDPNVRREARKALDKLKER